MDANLGSLDRVYEALAAPGGGKVKQPRATEMVRGWCALCLCVRASPISPGGDCSIFYSFPYNPAWWRACPFSHMHPAGFSFFFFPVA